MIIAAFGMPVIIGSVGLGVDTIQWTLWKRQLQRAADSAAFAGAYGLAQAKSVDSTVRLDLAKVTGVPVTISAIENAPTVGANAGNARAVRVALTTTKALPFSGLFVDSPPVIAAEATAALVPGSPHCVISLENSTTVGITATGSSTVALNCGIASNSTGADAISASGNTRITASPITAVGGLSDSNNYVGPHVLEPYSPPQPDPFAALPNPQAEVPQPCSGGNVSVAPNATRNITPGCYTALDIRGTLNLAAGTYYIDGGDFTANSQATINGTAGVTIILTNHNAGPNPAIGSVSFNGGATINLAAPTTGPYAGVLLYKDRRAPFTSNFINGNSNSRLTGAVYIPSGEIDLNGTANIDTDCIQLIGRRVVFSGNSTITNTCPVGAGGPPIVGLRVRLVG